MNTLEQLKVSLVQTELIWEKPSENRSRIGKFINEAEKSDLIVLPEMFSTGFSMNSSAMAEAMDGPTVKWMLDQARSLETYICGSLIIEERGQFYNRFIWAQPDGELQYYDKRHLFRMSAENDHYSGGREKLFLELKGFRICPQICYDLRFPAWSRNDANNDSGYDLLLYVANWPSVRRDHWTSLLKTRAIENLCYTIGVNRIGIDGNDVLYAGDSVCLDYNGQTMLDLKSQNEIANITLNKHSLLEYRNSFPAHLDADCYTVDL